MYSSKITLRKALRLFSSVDPSSGGELDMKQYIGMIEVLGEGGELQPLHWNPKHLVDGRAILVVDEKEAVIWVWLGHGTSLIQRTTTLRQARFIMRNGIHVEGVGFGTKCTTFIEVSGNLKTAKAAPLRKLLEDYPKEADFLIVVEETEEISTFDETFQDRVEGFEQAIMPEPIRQATPVRRRMLTYEEQLATKVLFAVADCYGQATMNPIGPNEFQVAVLRLQLRFILEGDNILFTEIRAASQTDIDAFSRCFGQQPQLTADGQQTIMPSITDVEAPSKEAGEEPFSVVDSMRKQLSELTSTGEPENLKEKEEAKKTPSSGDEENEEGGSSDFEFFS